MRIKNAGITREELPFDCVHYESSGCVITVVVRDDKSEVLNKLSYMNPILMEEIPIDFEDMFIEKSGNGGMRSACPLYVSRLYDSFLL